MQKKRSNHRRSKGNGPPPIWHIVRYLNGAYRDRNAIHFAAAVRVLAEYYNSAEQVLATDWQHASLGDG